MKIFRTQRKYWIRKGLFVAALTVVALLVNRQSPSITVWLVYLFAAWFSGGTPGALLRTHLEMSGEELRGWGNGEGLYARWSEVVYARREEERPGRYWLVIGTRDAAYAMPLELLDAEGIWQEVQQRAPQAAFAEDASQKLVEAQEAAWEKRVGALLPPFILTMGRRFFWLLTLGVLGWGAVGLFLPALLPAGWVSLATLCSGAAILLTLLFFLSITHTLRVDAEALTVRTVRGHYRLNWSELESVRSDPGNTVVVFEGNGKRLVCAPYILGGAQKDSSMEYITLKLRQKKIEITRQPRLLVMPIACSQSAKVERL